MPSLADGVIRHAIKQVEKSGKQKSLTDGQGRGTGKVEAPGHRRCGRQLQRFAIAGRALAALTLLHRKPVLAIEAAELLVVHVRALSFQQEPNAAIAEAPAFGRDLAHPPADIGVVRHALAPHRLRIDADETASAALGGVVFDHRLGRGPLRLGRRQDCPKRSFKTAMSRCASANSRFSRAIKLSSVLSLRASGSHNN